MRATSTAPALPDRPEPPRPPTRMEQRFLDFAADINATDAFATGELAFLATIVVQANFPYRDPGDCTFVRKNGNYTLTLQAPPDIGLPYGRYPRLLLAFLCREAVRTKSREIHLGESLSAFMRTVGVRASGGARGPLRRFREQASRLFATTISCSWTETAKAIHTQTRDRHPHRLPIRHLVGLLRRPASP